MPVILGVGELATFIYQRRKSFIFMKPRERISEEFVIVKGIVNSKVRVSLHYFSLCTCYYCIFGVCYVIVITHFRGKYEIINPKKQGRSPFEVLIDLTFL